MITPDWGGAIDAFIEARAACGYPRTTQNTRRQHLQHLARRTSSGPWALTGDDLVGYVAAQNWERETRRGRRGTFVAFWTWGVGTGRTHDDPTTALATIRASDPDPRPVPDRVYLAALIRADDPEGYARRLQQDVLARTRLHCSVGIGDNLMRAKNATNFGKPRGTFRLTAENWLEVMGHRPTIALWGVGSKVSKRLALRGISTVAQLAVGDPDALTDESGPRMGLWYRQLGRGDGSNVVDDTPWVARGHSKETTFQIDIVAPAEIEDAARRLLGEVLAEVAAEHRPVVGLGLKVRYAPFFTKTFTKKIPATSDHEVVLTRTMELVAKIEPGRPIRVLGVRAEMAMPDDSREGHTPTRGGW